MTSSPGPARSAERGSASATQLDASQRAALAQVRDGGAVVVLGGPGTGKSLLAVEAAVQAVERDGLAPHEVLVMTSDRQAAARLRSSLTRRLGRTTKGSLVASVMSTAYSIVRADALANGQAAPSVIIGAEQDRRIKDLIEGHLTGLAAPIQWPEYITAQVQSLSGFRGELRDVLMRCAERGIGAAELHELAQRHNRPLWDAVASLLAEYQAVLDHESAVAGAGRRYDLAAMVDTAARVVESGRYRAAPWRLVIVDDYQEATSATARLVAALQGNGARIALFGDPDSAVQTFRGASPRLLRIALSQVGSMPGALGATSAVLETDWRMPVNVHAAAARVASCIAVAAGPRQRGAAPRRDAAAGAIDRATLASSAQEAAFVVRTLREEHLLRATPWSAMAVVARTAQQAAGYRRALTAAGVPVVVGAAQLALRDEPAVRPLLDIADIVTSQRHLDEATAVELLASPYGGLDALDLRRLRRWLLRESRDAGRHAASGDLLVAAIANPALLDGAPATLVTGVLRVARQLAAARRLVSDAASAAAVDAGQGLWAIWQAGGLAEVWRAAALGGGPDGMRADQNLDAVIALLRSAEFVTQREGHTPLGVFVRDLLDRSLAADSVAARAHRSQAVTVTTPFSVAGSEYDVVIVAGVHEETWPNLTIRDSLLGAQALAELVDTHTMVDDPVAARRAVLDDELRMFHVALSRARRRLVVTAVDDEDTSPSRLCDLVTEHDTAVADGGTTIPFDLRGVVLAGRRGLARQYATAQADADTARRWAALLADLAELGVDPADPLGWYGVNAPSTMEPLSDGTVAVSVSPSKIATVHECALRWALEAAGGVAARERAASLGTLVHAIAADYPAADEATLTAALDERWSLLGLEDSLSTRRLKVKALRAIRGLAAYFHDTGEPLAVEQSFRFATDNAVVAGQMDRIDAGPEQGTAVVTDFKTASTPESAASAAVNPQLAAYQLGLAQAAPNVACVGAQLVYPLGTASASYTVRSQQSLDSAADPTWAARMVDGAGRIMGAARMWAQINPGCQFCPVVASCPVQDRGRGVTRARSSAVGADAVVTAPLSEFSDVGARTAQASGASAEPPQADDEGSQS